MSDHHRWLDELHQDPKATAMDPATRAQLERMLSTQPRFRALDGEAASRVRAVLPKTPPGGAGLNRLGTGLSRLRPTPSLSASPTISLLGAAGLGALFMLAVQTGRSLFEPSAWMDAEPSSAQLASQNAAVSLPWQESQTASGKTHGLRFSVSDARSVAATRGRTAPLTSPRDLWTAWQWDRVSCSALVFGSFSVETSEVSGLAAGCPLLSGNKFYRAEAEMSVTPSHADGSSVSPNLAIAQANRQPATESVLPDVGTRGSPLAAVPEPVGETAGRDCNAGELERDCALGVTAREPSNDGARPGRRVARAVFSANDTSDSLREETLLLEAARADLARYPQRALAAAQQHQARFNRGQLVAQRTLIQIEAYLRLGQETRAVALSRSLSNPLFHQRANKLLLRYGAAE